MEEINNFVKGFKAINTPYDKVDNSLYHKRHVMTAIDQLIGGAETDGGKIIEQTDDTVGELPDKPSSMFGAFKKGVYKRSLEQAKRDEEDKGTRIPEGKEVMKKVIKGGTVIIYIMLLPLIPWYYVMKYSFQKLRVFFNRILKPL
jgi:hypothetical protein|tara:strand:- start:3422 stop:3856 length:435 start_codon:yes stop_codon:yes gene_type:complete